MTPEPSRPVADWLARIWEWHRTPQFLEYLFESFEVRIPDLASFDRLYIYQVEEGDLEKGMFRHGSVIQWWEVNDAGLRECRRPECMIGSVDVPEKMRGSFYRWPHISFLLRDDSIGFGECFGPELFNRKVGRMSKVANGVEITDVRVILRHKDL
jgi:hypothetical protein